MMVGLFCEVFSNTSKLELDGVRYSTDSWAELVVKDKRYDTRSFAKTKIRLIDVTETLDQYRRLFQQISTNTDMMRVEDLYAQLKALMNEESVPETLQSDLTLAQMRLDEGVRAVRLYDDGVERISRELDAVSRSGNAYNALKLCRDATALRYNTPASGMYVYNPAQIEELDNLIHACKAYAEKGFADKWIKHQACSDIEHLSGFKAFAKKAKELFESFGYIQEAIELQAQVDSETARINLLMEQQSLLADCKAFLESSQVERGLTMKNLESLQERGGRLLKLFDTFDYNLDRRFRVVQQDMTNRLGEIHKAMNDLKAELI